MTGATIAAVLRVCRRTTTPPAGTGCTTRPRRPLGTPTFARVPHLALQRRSVRG